MKPRSRVEDSLLHKHVSMPYLICSPRSIDDDFIPRCSRTLVPGHFLTGRQKTGKIHGRKLPELGLFYPRELQGADRELLTPVDTGRLGLPSHRRTRCWRDCRPSLAGARSVERQQQQARLHPSRPLFAQYLLDLARHASGPRPSRADPRAMSLPRPRRRKDVPTTTRMIRASAMQGHSSAGKRPGASFGVLARTQ